MPDTVQTKLNLEKPGEKPAEKPAKPVYKRACPDCGELIPKTSMFCQYCGASMSSKASNVKCELCGDRLKVEMLDEPMHYCARCHRYTEIVKK